MDIILIFLAIISVVGLVVLLRFRKKKERKEAPVVKMGKRAPYQANPDYINLHTQEVAKYDAFMGLYYTASSRVPLSRWGLERSPESWRVVE